MVHGERRLRWLRRMLQVTALAGTLLVGIIAASLIVSQTPWFRDWLRRYIVRESKQYLNGELAIGGLSGNLFFGVNLNDVTVDVSGERVVAVKALELDYSVFDFISRDIILDEIKLHEPVILAERDRNGWNLARLIKKERQEADRRGPKRPITLGSIEVEDASVEIRDALAPSGYRMPRRIDALDIKAGFQYEPVHYSIELDHVSFRGASPQFDMRELAGKIAVRDDNLYFDSVTMKTTETSVTIDGVVEQYLRTPVVKLTTTGKISLPEIGRVLPAVSGYRLHPDVDIRASGPAENLLLDLDVRSEAGNARGALTADVKAPELAFRGDLDVERLNLAPLTKNATERSNITGHAKIDLRLSTRPAGVRALDRMRGTYTFSGPYVLAQGYEARSVRASGRIDGPRITLDARADAYGGTATARGFIVTPARGRAVALDLRGSADSVDLRDLPPSLGIPKLATNLSTSAYHVRGSGGSYSGSATLKRSAVEGATLSSGTMTTFNVTPRAVSFTAEGHAANVDVQRFGRALKVPELTEPQYEGRINATYDVRGSVDRVRAAAAAKPGRTASTFDRVVLDARGVVTDSPFGGGRVTRLEFDTDLDRGALNVRAKGDVVGVDVARFVDREELRGQLTGTVDTTVAIADVGAPIKAADVTVDARGALTNATLWGGRLPAVAFETRMDRGALDVRANGSFEGFDPARLTGRQNLAGSVSGTVTATIAIADVTAPIAPEDVTAEGTLTLAKSTVGGLEIDAANIEGKYVDQIGDIARFDIAGPDLKANATGRLALDRTSQSNLKYHVEAVDLESLAKLAGRENVRGAAILDGTLTGNAASLTTTGTLNGSNLAYEKNSALDLNSKYTVTVPDLRFAAARVEATSTATFVKTAGFDISELTATTTYDNQRLEFTTNVKERTRELDATGTLILHPDHQEVHLPRLALRTQGLEWQLAPTSEALVQYGRGRVELSGVRLVSADQSLNVDGALALKGSDTAGTIRVQARNVDLQQLETLLLQNRGFAGRLNADATITGSTANPLVDGRIQVDGGAFKTYKYESLVADVKYSDPRLQIDATLRQSPTESITARGSVPRTLFEKGDSGHISPRGEDQIDLQIASSQINLGFVQAFTDAVTNVTGTMQADVHVTGSGHDPHMSGYISIQNGAFGVPLGGVSYTGLNTRIDLKTDRIDLATFTILDEHGKAATVSGNLAVHERQVGAINITIETRDFELIDNELGDVGVDAQLRIRGELRRPRIDGEIRLEDGRLEIDQILQLFYDPYSVEALPEVVSAERTVEGAGSAKEATDRALQQAERSAAPPGAEARPAGAPPAPGGIFGPMALNVRLRIPDNLVLRGNDLRPGGPTGAAIGGVHATVGGDVRVLKNPGGQMTLVGNVETIRGRYDFQGRRFELVRGGQIKFVGTPEINPAIDVSATRLIPNTGVEARVRITGTARTPELALSSTPPLEESDILALIVFNRPVNELGTGERSSLAATAGGIATGFLATPLGESIGKALDLDLFEITTTTEEGELGAGVTLGHQIGDRAFVKLRQQFGERNVSEFMLEYQLFQFLRLQATAAPETTGSGNRLNQRRIERGGIDLIFFFSY